MRSDPEPLDSRWNRKTNGAAMKTDPDAAEASVTHGSESQGRMRLVLPEKSLITSSEVLNAGWQRIKAASKLT